jgi:hypothetical protein
MDPYRTTAHGLIDQRDPIIFSPTRFTHQRPSDGPSREKWLQGNHCCQGIFFSDLFRFLVVFFFITLKNRKIKHYEIECFKKKNEKYEKSYKMRDLPSWQDKSPGRFLGLSLKRSQCKFGTALPCTTPRPAPKSSTSDLA